MLNGLIPDGPMSRASVNGRSHSNSNPNSDPNSNSIPIFFPISYPTTSPPTPFRFPILLRPAQAYRTALVNRLKPHCLNTKCSRVVQISKLQCQETAGSDWSIPPRPPSSPCQFAGIGGGIFWACVRNALQHKQAALLCTFSRASSRIVSLVTGTSASF